MTSISPEVLMPFYGWAFLRSSQEDQAESRLRGMLRKEGLSIEHFNGIVALSTEARAAVAYRLIASDVKAPLLNALRLLGRARLFRDTVELHEFECVEQHTVSTGLPFDTQIRLVREWFNAGERTCEHFADVMGWASRCPTAIPKQGGWGAILRKRIGDARWSSPVPLPVITEDVKVSVILDGASVLREGRSMGNCLASPETAYPYVLACLGGDMLICRLEATDSPVMCATLAIEKDETGWSIGDFQTVGSGIPPARLRHAAKRLVTDLNERQGFGDSTDESDTCLDIPPFLRRTRR